MAIRSRFKVDGGSKQQQHHWKGFRELSFNLSGIQLATVKRKLNVDRLDVPSPLLQVMNVLYTDRLADFAAQRGLMHIG
jgi:hypothetical protein